MKKLLLLFLALSLRTASAATTYTEFYCNSTGTNINAGSTTNATPTFSATSGDWVASTGVWTKAGANPVTGGVTVGSWASVYIDGATTAVFVGRVTAADDTADTVTVSIVACTGIPPADGTGTRSIRVGGAWYGPWYAGATVDNLPFTFANGLMTNTSGNATRVNLSNSRIYGTTNVTVPSNGPVTFQGYGTNAADLGKSWITGSTVGNGYTSVTVSGANVSLVDLIFATNGTSGSAGILVSISGSECYMLRCVTRDGRGPGIFLSALDVIEECEAFLCNAGNGIQGVIQLSTSGSVAKRCIAHDNAGTGSSGFALGSGGCSLIDCIADTNGRDGATVSSAIAAYISGCDFYNNVTNGINLTGASSTLINIENCNFIGNGVGLTGAYAINSSGSLIRNGSVINCAFGVGTATNGSGGANIIAGTGLDEIGSIVYGNNLTPWVDPANGDFRISSAAAINAGRGKFTQTQASYGGAIAYPDIGSAQHLESVATGGGSYPFVQ
jgi:hypothetical protein